MSAGRILEFDISNSGIPCPAFLLHDEFDFVEVCFPLAASRDLHEPGSFKLLDEVVHPRGAHAQIFPKPLLAGEAAILMPRVMEKQRVGKFGTQAQGVVRQDEIWHLGKTRSNDGIEGIELDGLLSDQIADRGEFSRAVFHV